MNKAGTAGRLGFFRDPLFLFLILGGLVFLVDQKTGEAGETSANTIEITPAVKRRLEDQWSLQMGRSASPAELQSLTDKWIREEVYYREALALGLDRNDTIIRRRLAQKLNFLTEDVADAAEPGEGELRAYYDASGDVFREPERFSFEHRYFSSERRADARRDAQAALDQQTAIGDPFMLQTRYSGLSEREISDLFGPEFASSLASLPMTPDQWQGPVPSEFGWHLVRVLAREPGYLPAFESVAAQVAERLRQQRRAEANEALFEQLRSRYQVRDLTQEAGG
ncbi:MAG: peptidyl-prolyl cis-trans isomerase [Pseudomonadota bacterium]